MFPHLSYTASLEQSPLSTLHERRENQCLSLYKSVLNHDNKLHEHLPDPVYHKNHLRIFLNAEQNVSKTVLSHIVSKNGIQLR
jgi:hypothetical protein